MSHILSTFQPSIAERINSNSILKQCNSSSLEMYSAMLSFSNCIKILETANFSYIGCLSFNL